MFGEFNDATQLKTSLTKYSIEFNDLAVQIRPHRIAYLRLLGRPYTLLYVRRSVDRLPGNPRFFLEICYTRPSCHSNYFYCTTLPPWIFPLVSSTKGRKHRNIAKVSARSKKNNLRRTMDTYYYYYTPALYWNLLKWPHSSSKTY